MPKTRQQILDEEEEKEMVQKWEKEINDKLVTVAVHRHQKLLEMILAVIGVIQNIV